MKIAPLYLLFVCVSLFAACTPAADPLPSWADGSSKDAVLQWLTAVTAEGGPDYIPPAGRLAVFDNDGASWCERPQYPSTLFQIELARSLARQGHLDGTQMPWPAWFANDRDALEEFGWTDAYRAFTGAFEGMTVEAYADSARAFMKRTRHPRWDVALTNLYYAPIIELKDLLEANGFTVWVVTAAEQDFVRTFIDGAFGIPPEHTMGAWVTPVYNQADDGGVNLVRSDRIVSNGNVHKVENIFARIGRRPVFALGNSDNDEPMCRYAVTGEHRGLALWVHHDDDEREYAYDDRVGEMADLCRDQPGAVEISMRRDWERVFVESGP